jgi:hypothetical protein
MGEPPVEVHLRLEVDQGQLTAGLTFYNRSSIPVFVERAKTLPGRSLEYNLFRIREGEQTIRFVGEMAKRPPPSPDDFVGIPPRGVMESRVRIDRWYRFLKESREYEICYQAVNSTCGDQPLFVMESNPLKIVYPER